MSPRRSSRPRGFVICVATGGNEVSLAIAKVYRLLDPVPGDPKSWVRVVDESGEDYLYPSKLFRALVLPKPVQRALAAAEN